MSMDLALVGTTAINVNYVRKKLKPRIGAKFKVRMVNMLDKANWMAMITISGNKDVRFRCTDGEILDEITIGD